MAGVARDLEMLRDDADETVMGGLLHRETSREGNDSVDLASNGLRSIEAPRCRPYPSYRRNGVACSATNDLADGCNLFCTRSLPGLHPLYT